MKSGHNASRGANNQNNDAKRGKNTQSETNIEVLTTEQVKHLAENSLIKNEKLPLKVLWDNKLAGLDAIKRVCES